MRTNLIGSAWKVVVCGRKSLNGKPYSAHMSGTVSSENGNEDIYDLTEQLVQSIREKNQEMELPHSIQITIETLKANRP